MTGITDVFATGISPAFLDCLNFSPASFLFLLNGITARYVYWYFWISGYSQDTNTESFVL